MEKDGENLSSASFVSTISAASSIHQPRPPDGPKPANQPFRARRSKVVRSPYLATSTPFQPGRRHSGAPPTTTQRGGAGGKPFAAKEKWVAAIKSSGFHPDGWSSSLTPTQPHPSASSFLQTLMRTPSFSAVVTASMMKTSKRKRTQSSAGSALSSGRDAISLGEEIQELKKQGNALTRERDLARARLRKTEAELQKREKEIEDLLAAGHLPTRDATRSLTGRKPDSGAVVSSLRQRIHALERALRQKEEACADLQRGASAARVRELQVESETYYQEVCRLQLLLSQQQKELLSGSPLSHRETQVKLKALSEAVARLSGQLEETQDKNKSLRAQLERLTAASPAPMRATHREQGLRGAIADRYLDHRRSEMLSAIVDLEMKLQEKENALQSLCREFEQKKSHYETRLGALTGSNRDAAQQVELLQGRVEEVEGGRNKLRNIVRKLKEDRTHYRALAEQTQMELQDVRERLQNEELSRTDVLRELDSLRQKHEDELRAREHAQRLARRKSQVFTPDRIRREAAATTLQQQWRRRQASQRQNEFQERELAAVDIQSALRAHISRRKQLETHPPPTITPSPSHSSTPTHHDIDEEGSENDEHSESVAIETIQSALRGYFTRQMVLQDLPSSAAERADGTLGSKASDTSPISREKSVTPRRRPTTSELWKAELLPNKNGGVLPLELGSESALVGYVAPRKSVAGREEALSAALQRKGSRSRRVRRTLLPKHLDSPWNRTKLEPSSGSDLDDADIESAGDATPPPGHRVPHRAPPRATAFSSNDSEQATSENMDQQLLADELR